MGIYRDCRYFTIWVALLSAAKPSFAQDSHTGADPTSLGSSSQIIPSATALALKKSPHSDVFFSLSQSKEDLGTIICKLAALSSECPSDLEKRKSLNYAWIAPFRSANTVALTREMRQRFLARLTATDAQGNPILSQQEKAFLVMSMSVYGSRMKRDGSPQSDANACGEELSPKSEEGRIECFNNISKYMGTAFKSLAKKVDALGDVNPDNIGDKTIAALITDDSTLWGANRSAFPNMIRALAISAETSSDKLGSYNPRYENDHAKIAQSLGFEAALQAVGESAKATEELTAVALEMNAPQPQVSKASSGDNKPGASLKGKVEQAVKHPIKTTGTLLKGAKTILVDNFLGGVKDTVVHAVKDPIEQHEEDKILKEAELHGVVDPLTGDVVINDELQPDPNVQSESLLAIHGGDPETPPVAAPETAPLQGNVAQSSAVDPKTGLPIVTSIAEGKKLLRAILAKLNNKYGPHGFDFVHDGRMSWAEADKFKRMLDKEGVLTSGEKAFLSLVMVGIGEVGGIKKAPCRKGAENWQAICVNDGYGIANGVAVFTTVRNRAESSSYNRSAAGAFMNSDDFDKDLSQRIFSSVVKPLQFSPWNQTGGSYVIGRNKKRYYVNWTGTIPTMFGSIETSLQSADDKLSGNIMGLNAERMINAYIHFTDPESNNASKFVRPGKKGTVYPIVYFSAPSAKLNGTFISTPSLSIDGKSVSPTAHRYGYAKGYMKAASK